MGGVVLSLPASSSCCWRARFRLNLERLRKRRRRLLLAPELEEEEVLLDSGEEEDLKVGARILPVTH